MVINNKPNTLDRVKEITGAIADLEKELSEIQSTCTHIPGIGFNKALDVKLSCEECGMDLGYPSRKDLDEFLEN